MGNNNFNGGVNNSQNMPPNMQPNMQNMQNMQPGMQGAPNMGMPMGPNMQMGPNMGQPYPQQMMRPSKQPMDPAKKKRIIIIVSVVSGVAVLGIALAIILLLVLRVNYSTAYNTAKELKPKIYDIYQSYDCEYVVDYVDSDYTSVKSYNEYINGCAKVFSSETNNLVNDLGNTDGVKRNEEIRLQFDKFKSVYDSVSPNYDELMAKLAVYKARHEFVVAVEDLSYSSSDAEFAAAADYLINSGNDELKAYGESWLERVKVVAVANRAYEAAPWGSKSQPSAEYDNKKREFDDWVAANKPDIDTIAPLNFDDMYDMYSEFEDLYDLISGTYELNYNAGSGDCDELLGEIYCE